MASVSYIWLLALLFLPQVFGPDYSDLRFLTIGMNLGFGCVGVIAALIPGRGPRALPVIASVWVVSLWCYVGVVSATV